MGACDALLTTSRNRNIYLTLTFSPSFQDKFKIHFMPCVNLINNAATGCKGNKNIESNGDFKTSIFWFGGSGKLILVR
jgi:hypothetical protein